jgi:hypothetical protein
VRPKPPRLGLLGGRRAKHHDLRAQLRRELHRQVPQAADADDADALAGLDDFHEAVVDGRAGALQRRGVGGGQAVGDLVQVGLEADVVVGEGAG